jgi:hypothetical protein
MKLWLDAYGAVERPSVLRSVLTLEATDAMTRTPIPLKVRESGPPGGGFGNTAEPSGEVSVGDVVAAGETGLAVGSAGWTLIRGGLNEVRVSEHGTRPLPSRLPGTGDHPAVPCPAQGAT